MGKSEQSKGSRLMTRMDSLAPVQDPAETEIRIRRDLAACFRLVAHFGWDDLVATHISARIPGSDEFLLNPNGQTFDEITASSLVKLNLDGTILSRNGNEVNPAGFVIHSAVHLGRPDAGCVVHLHGKYGAALSALEEGVLPLTQTAMMICDDVAFHDFEGIAFELGERVRLQADLGEKNIMILRNHGTLTLGRTVASAFLRAYWLEWCAAVQLAAAKSGGAIHYPSADAMTVTRGQTEELSIEDFAVSWVWPAMLRKAARLDSGFQD
jgi:ribulose-5-phosphate 4-epimerase/fuculose-1-phosphate aldolase